MAKLLKLRRGTTSQHSSFTGAEGEVTVDTTKDTLVVHDGSTAGGVPLAKEAGNIATATEATNITAVANNSTDETVYPTFVDGATGTQGIETDTGLTYNPSSGKLTATEFVGNIDAVNGDFDGTLEADAYTVDGTALNEYIADTVGAMVTGNTETNITVTYQDSDNTLDFAVSNATGLTGSPDITVNDVTAASLDISGNADIDGTMEADAYTVNGTALDTHIAGVTVTNATNSAHVLVTDNESTNENNLIAFVENATTATGNVGLEMDGNFYYNPSSGTLTVAALSVPAISCTTVTTTSDLTVGGNLTVSGTTTTVNTATLEVEDKNIELGKVSSPSDTTADGGGITLKGATDKEIKWVNSTDNWTFNQNIEVTQNGTSDAGQIKVIGGEGNHATLYLVADEGDDNGDYWLIQSAPGDNNLYFQNKTSGSYATKGIITEEGEVHDAIGDLRAIPANATTSAYTLVAADRGKCVTNTSGGVTVPYNVFAAGDAVTIVNHSGSDITITQGSNMTLYNSADAATGNRTLAGRGMATVWYQAQNLAYISGAGLS